MNDKKKLSLNTNLSPEWLVVHWFSLAKGYGFARKPGSKKDIFLHYSMYANVNNFAPPIKGDHILCEMHFTKNELTIKQVLKVKEKNPEQAQQIKAKITNKEIKPARFMLMNDRAELREVEGIIKWFNPLKGYGFARLAKGRSDVFIHGAVVEEEGLAQKLLPGTKIKMKVTLSERGAEARTVEILPE